MKVFVYSKKTNRKIAVIEGVVSIQDPAASKLIFFITESGEAFSFDKSEVKTTSYQN